jgi:hypothetical protein
MTTHSTIRRAGGITALAAVAVSLTITPAMASPNDAALARQGTAQFHDSTLATGSSDWFKVTDVNGISCIDSPAGGMGIHYVNGARLIDSEVIASQPEAVIYEPQKDGSLSLVAVEYIVLKDAWTEVDPPRLFGTDFELVEAGNRYGLPDFYELHAWIWRNNPNGMNNDWNPNVTCQFAS